jgi:hypothetical protein
MERLKARAQWLVVVAAVVIVPTAVAQNDIEDPGSFPGAWYRIAFDGSGNYLYGDGHGYGGGTWYFYPQTEWWRQWYYNEPYSTYRQGYLEYQVYIKAVDSRLPSSAEIRFNWSTAQWSGLRESHPPLPGDVPTTATESAYMQSKHLFLVDNAFIGTIEPIASYTIREYNPEWVSIDVRGRNVCMYRGAFHWCVANDSPTGACYNSDTGQCYTCFEGDCPPPYEWLGPGTSCPDPLPPVSSPVPIYRLWSTIRSIHLYTADPNEKDRLLADPVEAWLDEGVAWRVFVRDTEPDGLPVYRFRSDASGARFYTISEAEKQMLMGNYAHVWTYDGIAFYAYSEGRAPTETLPVYRFWSGALGHHFYTINKAERDTLIKDYSYVWLYEGVAWHAYPAVSTVSP